MAMSRVALLLGILLVVGCSKLEPTSGKAPAPVAQKSDPEPEPPPANVPQKVNPGPIAPPNLGRIDNAKMFAEYAEDEARADGIYKGKFMTLSIGVTVIGQEGNAPYVAMSTIFKADGTPDVPNYYFHFPRELEAEVAKLSVGARCSIEGMCVGRTTDNINRAGLGPKYSWRLKFFRCKLVPEG
jgi:hypothetical protein